MSLTIRTAANRDCDAIYEISCSVHLSSLYRRLIPPSHYDDFLRRYTPDALQRARYCDEMAKRLQNPDWHVWVAELDGAVVGFTLAHDEGDIFALKGLFVLSDHQGKGVGKQLFQQSCEAAKGPQTISLEVIEQNAHAIGIYERAGFRRENSSAKNFFGARMISMSRNAH